MGKRHYCQLLTRVILIAKMGIAMVNLRGTTNAARIAHSRWLPPADLVPAPTPARLQR